VTASDAGVDVCEDGKIVARFFAGHITPKAAETK
jgi:hypothetical protein